MIANVVVVIAGLLFVAALADAAQSDLRRFRIHNRAPLLLLASFVPAGLAAGLDGGEWLAHLGAALVVFAVAAALFVLGIWGGGDAKLLPAAVLWVGPAGLARFIMIMALAGGGLAVVALLARRVGLAPSGPVRDWGERLAASGHVPYGLAIAAAGLDWWIIAMLPRLMG
ncbi:prepilin peptidase [Magnetospirillum sp. SS-4]|uniref:A24 family peptidase n=1 Tax=Magnetospirillum sp. SS-4 TaxID=2681465 RepID=UPI0013809BEC|nr:prepilin peptidase [Magnetospirillum sp. SS-4]CAA7616835.1 Flp pilus assembly protein, protease CpaA [Magnetospirillum sp. SS-4]